MACKAVTTGQVSRRGRASVEWYKEGKAQYYCYGYIDSMTDTLLPECLECPDHVDKAQTDLDEYYKGAAIE